MKISLERSGTVVIRSVTDTEIRIADVRYGRTVALTSEAVLESWVDKTVPELVAADFAEILATEPEVIVLGTGRASLFAPRELVFALARQGVGLEVMNTHAAARTFNVLASEGRQAAAVLYVD